MNEYDHILLVIHFTQFSTDIFVSHISIIIRHILQKEIAKTVKKILHINTISRINLFLSLALILFIFSQPAIHLRPHHLLMLFLKFFLLFLINVYLPSSQRSLSKSYLPINQQKFYVYISKLRYNLIFGHFIFELLLLQLRHHLKPFGEA